MNARGLFVLLCWAAIAVTTSGQSGTAQEALEAARKTAVLDGDCPAAIKQYQAIVTRFEKTDRAAAARALLGMAECYEKTGNSQDAQRTYAQLLRDYEDQPTVAAQARERTSPAPAADPPPPGAGPFKALAPDVRLSLTSILSPEGTRTLEQDSRGLVVRELATGRDRVIVPLRVAGSPNPTHRLASAIWSPDGLRVAYFSQDLRQTDETSSPQPSARTLRVVIVATGQIREICELAAAPPALTILEWTGRDEIIYSLGPRAGRIDDATGTGGLARGAGTEFYAVSVNNGVARKAFSLDSALAAHIGNSTPDGRRMLVVRAEKLVAVDLAGGGEEELSLGIGPAYPRVSPDGRLVAFLSRQDGAWAAYVAPLAQPIRNPIRITYVEARRSDPPTLGLAQGFRWASNGTLSLEFRDSETNVYRVDMNPATGLPASAPERLTRDLDGVEPRISPDGKHILFAQPLTREANLGAVFVVPADGGKAREIVRLPPARFLSPLRFSRTFGWLSAGTIFAAGQSDELRSFDLATGTNSSLAHTSPLGRTVVFAQNAEQQGWIEPAGEPRARVGARFQYLAASQEFVYEAFDQFGFPTLVARSIASGSERILWRRHPTVLFGPQDWQISPDGKSLAYWGPPPGVMFPEDAIPARTDTPFALNILSVQDATTRTLLSRPTGGPFATRIVWSPDSQRILYIAAGGNSRSFSPQVVDITSGGSTRLFSESVAANLDVTADWLGGWDWSPDGRFIVFDATVEATHRLRWGGVTHNAVLAHGRR